MAMTRRCAINIEAIEKTTLDYRQTHIVLGRAVITFLLAVESDLLRKRYAVPTHQQTPQHFHFESSAALTLSHVKGPSKPYVMTFYPLDYARFLRAVDQTAAYLYTLLEDTG
jgi:hypothetical protein